MTEFKAMLAMLIEATQALALSPREQEQLLPEFVALPDELAQNFSDVFRLTDQIQEAGLIDAEAEKLLRLIETELQVMTNQETS